MSWNDIGLQLAEVLLPVVATLCIALIGYGITYLKKQTQNIQSEVARKALQDALTEAEIVACDAVRATNQVLVSAMKDKSADGKLTRAEAVAAMNMAKEYFVQHLTAGSKQVLQAAIGPLNEWVESYLEAKLGEEKVITAQQKVAAVAAPLSSGQTQ